MIVTEETKNSLMLLIKQCFVENRVLDRMVSVLGTKFAYNNTADLVHKNIAHYFPMLSDLIGEKCLERYNISVEYGATPSATEDYNSALDIIVLLKQRVVDFQTMMMGVAKIAFDNNDLHVFADMQELMREYNQIVEQCILLEDKMVAYGTDMSYDAHVHGFWVLGE